MNGNTKLDTAFEGQCPVPVQRDPSECSLESPLKTPGIETSVQGLWWPWSSLPPLLTPPLSLHFYHSSLHLCHSTSGNSTALAPPTSRPAPKAINFDLDRALIRIRCNFLCWLSFFWWSIDLHDHVSICGYVISNGWS